MALATLPTQAVAPMVQPGSTAPMTSNLTLGMANPMATNTMVATGAAPVPQGPVAPTMPTFADGTGPNWARLKAMGIAVPEGMDTSMGIGQGSLASLQAMDPNTRAYYDYSNAKRKFDNAQNYNNLQASAQQGLVNAYSDQAARQAATQANLAKQAELAAQSKIASKAMGDAQYAQSQQWLKDGGGASYEDQMKASLANRVGAQQAKPKSAVQAPPKMSQAQFQQLQKTNPQKAQQYQQAVQNYQRSQQPQGPAQPQQSSGPDWGGMATGLGMNLGGKALSSFGVPESLTKGAMGFLGKLF